MPDNKEEKAKRKRAVALVEYKPNDLGIRDEAFVTEGNNLKSFYAKNFPDTDLEVIPFYGQEEFKSAKEKIKDVEDVFLMGHMGSKIAGIDHDTMAKTLKESGTKNCTIGSCSFEGYADIYKNQGFQNLKWREKEPWLGVWDNAKDIDSAFFAKRLIPNPEPTGQTANVTKPVQGVHFNRIFNRPKEEAVPAPARPNPAFFK